MKKKLLSLGIASAIMISQSINIFASDNTISSEYKIDIERVKANAITDVISNPTTIVNFNGEQYEHSKGDKNSINETVDIDYHDAEATTIITAVVAPKTIVDIDIPLANGYKPACFNKLNKIKK